MEKNQNLNLLSLKNHLTFLSKYIDNFFTLFIVKTYLIEEKMLSKII